PETDAAGYSSARATPRSATSPSARSSCRALDCYPKMADSEPCPPLGTLDPTDPSRLQSPTERQGQVAPQPPPASLRRRLDLHPAEPAGLQQRVRLRQPDSDE